MNLRAQVRAPPVRIDGSAAGKVGVGDSPHGTRWQTVHDVIGQVGGGARHTELGIELGGDGVVHDPVALGRGSGYRNGGGTVDDGNGVAGTSRGLDEGELVVRAGGVLRGKVGRIGTVAVGVVTEHGVTQTFDGIRGGGIGGDDPHYQDGFGASDGKATIAIGTVAVGDRGNVGSAVEACSICTRMCGSVLESQCLAGRDDNCSRGLVNLGPRGKFQTNTRSALTGMTLGGKDDPLGLVGDMIGDVDSVRSAVGLLARNVGFLDGVVGVLDLDDRGMVAGGGIGGSLETTTRRRSIVGVCTSISGHFATLADKLGFGGGCDEAKA